MECFVSQPNSVVLDIAVNPKGKGQECMDQVCRILGIVEQDYFGLLYKGRGGENLWLNLRNRLDRQLAGPPPYRLQLKVKFFVPPHNLIQQATRQQFYEQVKAEFESQKLVAELEDQMIRMLALIVQAEHGNFDQRTHQMNLYKTMLPDNYEPTPELIHKIVDSHAHLVGLSKESAQYKLLQEAAVLQNYGVEYHEVNYGGETIHVGIGPTGVFLYNASMELIEKLEYVTITKAEHVGKNCVLKVMNDNGTERDIMLRLVTQSVANAMYRCITEMHSFFCCDTVHNEVSTQFSRDLKGTLASLFNEKTTLGRDYVFDIKRTSREAYDHARRLLYQPVPLTGMTGESMISDKDSHDCDTPPLSAEEKCQLRVRSRSNFLSRSWYRIRVQKHATGYCKLTEILLKNGNAPVQQTKASKKRPESVGV
ncbi:E3 ubiquitin-protein ligase MYLIP-like isoform X2 [Mercenaria mercenaria]|uniref:E3 ubiquitin-protein ligase MYLIP-like isoform X2 n=1 Tax=Mercenaria mercenaria TaxID=6596 RepID=UPI00234F664E|nr:E3 ubiquitin-protein ligase MYLIP-like isoform X2 [Mercenaria mercenaria]